MNEISEILNNIKDVYFSSLSNDEKYIKLSRLWKDFYVLCGEKNIFLDEVEDLRMIWENECYSIYQEPKFQKLNIEEVKKVIFCLEEIINLNKNGIQAGITLEEANLILDYVVYEVRNIFSSLGINLKSNSLNGYCELGQGLSIRFLESLGLKVTKNTACNSFDYELNHCFGTVMIPVEIDGKVENKIFLIDTTYRQFFTSTRCNEGMYYKNNEKPDPGYFVKDEEVAKKIMRDGYILLDEYTAKCYGEGFYFSSLDKENITMHNNINYFKNIINDDSDYVLDFDEMEGLEIENPIKINDRSL